MLKCFYANDDSLTNNFCEFKVRIKVSNCMIVGITEVKTKKQRFLQNPAELEIDGYTLYQSNITDNRGRGVILYISKLLESSPFIILNPVFQESIWAEIRLNKQDSFLVGVVYRSPARIIDNNVYLNNIITEAVNSSRSHFLLLGDFNYPNISWEHYSVRS